MTGIPWFDRKEISVELSKRIEGFLAGYRQNCALLGPEAVGKTTLLMRLLKGHLSCSGFVPLYVEVAEEESFSEWVTQFIQSLSSGVLQAKEKEPPPSELSHLLAAASSWIPKTVLMARRLLEWAEAGRTEEVYAEVWELPHQMTQEIGLACLLVLDEFHRLQKFPVKDPFGRLGRSIMVQSTTLYLVSSSRPRAARMILREGLNLLFGQFETVEMGPLDPIACRQAIRAAWPSITTDPFLEYLLMELAQGYPACLDLLLQGVVDRERLDPHEDEERIVLDTLESLLLEPSGALRQRFESRVKSLPAHRSRTIWIQVLAAVAGGNHRVHQIADAAGRSSSQITRALRVLEQAGLLAKSGVFYKIPDRLFRLWIDTAYPLLKSGGLTDPVLLRARFRDSAWAWMMKARDMIHQPIEQQVAALLRSWDGELVEVDGHRILLPPFDRVEQIAGIQGHCAIVAHRAHPAGTGWLVIPWAGSLEESLGRAIVQWVPQCGLKNPRMVLLGAQPVEMNARLILQQAQIRLWGLDVLNNLLDLYGLARIPLPAGVQPALARTQPILPEQAPSSMIGRNAQRGR